MDEKQGEAEALQGLCGSGHPSIGYLKSLILGNSDWGNSTAGLGFVATASRGGPVCDR